MTTAYVTTLCNGDGYLPGVEVLGKSLEASGSTTPRIVLLTADISQTARARLAHLGWQLRDIEPIENPAGDRLLFPRFASVFAKLRSWQLVDLDRVVLLEPSADVPAHDRCACGRGQLRRRRPGVPQHVLRRLVRDARHAPPARRLQHGALHLPVPARPPDARGNARARDQDRPLHGAEAVGGEGDAHRRKRGGTSTSQRTPSRRRRGRRRCTPSRTGPSTTWRRWCSGSSTRGPTGECPFGPSATRRREPDAEIRARSARPSVSESGENVPRGFAAWNLRDRSPFCPRTGRPGACCACASPSRGPGACGCRAAAPSS